MTQEDEYNHILKDVFNRVKNLEKGVLFECIEILVDPRHAKKIIRQFDIKKSDSHSEDLRVLEKIPFLNPLLIISIVSNPVSSFFHNVFMHSPSSTSDHTNPMNAEIQVSNVESSNPIDNALSQARHLFDYISPVLAIVVIALAVTGLYFIGRKNKKSSNKGNRTTSKPQQDGSLSPGMYDNRGSFEEENNIIFQQVLECSVDLCLVIPCNRIASDLRSQMDQGKELSASDTITLVDNSAYFLVAKSREEPMFQLDENFKEFPEDGYLFIRLRISNGGDLTKIDLPGSLSRALSSQEPMAIQEIGLQQDFSNLEKFHRA
ncbi:hypothetical protein [Leptolyngbya sp. BC1307]|uniref:hypothetical protein n=1 Tax=Leptolyngbya sp. BC1307 TaxID=2029589 RepID=UPI000EFA31C7|nr:hypothetical protein [Leptolyngbya sp. BC1307]